MIRSVPVTADLVPALSNLATASFSETFGHLYPPEDLAAFLAKSYTPEKLLAETSDRTQYWRMWFDGDHAIAYVHLGPVTLPHAEADRQRHGEIKRIYVLQSHQGQGLGRIALSHALDYLTGTYGDAPQWLGVWSGNTKAQGLYAKYGFERAGEYVFPVGQTMDDEFILKRVTTTETPRHSPRS